MRSFLFSFFLSLFLSFSISHYNLLFHSFVSMYLKNSLPRLFDLEIHAGTLYPFEIYSLNVFLSHTSKFPQLRLHSSFFINLLFETVDQQQ